MSTIKANAWQRLDGTAVGTILQVVTATRTDAQYGSSTSWVDTGLQCTITPKFATSKILVEYLLNFSVDGHVGCRLMRGATPLLIGDASSSRTQATHWTWSQGSAAFNYSTNPLSNCYVDSPATTTAVTYKLQAASPHSSTYYFGMNYHPYNDGDAGWCGRVGSVMTLMEIAA